MFKAAADPQPVVLVVAVVVVVVVVVTVSVYAEEITVNWKCGALVACAMRRQTVVCVSLSF